jgi:hypothetical protein
MAHAETTKPVVRTFTLTMSEDEADCVLEVLGNAAGSDLLFAVYTALRQAFGDGRYGSSVWRSTSSRVELR